jgi:hypothetical protein
MGREPKFTFNPILMDAPEENREESILSIYKNGQMQISKSTVLNHALHGAFVDILWDERKRAFGFRKMNGLVLPQNEWKKTYRLLTADPKTGQVKVAIGRILNKIGLGGQDFKKLPLKKYLGLTDAGEIYYVIIPKANATLRDTEEL